MGTIDLTLDQGQYLLQGHLADRERIYLNAGVTQMSFGQFNVCIETEALTHAYHANAQSDTPVQIRFTTVTCPPNERPAIQIIRSLDNQTGLNN